jgi:hypothetical protein
LAKGAVPAVPGLDPGIVPAIHAMQKEATPRMPGSRPGRTRRVRPDSALSPLPPPPNTDPDALDRAVAAAYGWPEDISTDDALARLLALNLERASE